MIALLLLAACTKSPAPVEPVDGPSAPSPAPADPSPTAPEPAPVDTALKGTFLSGPCEGRTYGREMTFTGDRFEAMDLVSPCPKDVQCVWSGIVTRKGTFAISGSEATLIFAGEPDPRAVALPSALTLGPPLHEVGALSCEYSAR